MKPARSGAQIEADRDAVLKNERGARGRHGNVGAALRVDVPPDRGAILLIHLARLVPAPDTGVKAGIGIAGRETGTERRREGDRLGGEVDGVDLVQLAGLSGNSERVVEDLDPVARREAEHLVAAQALHRELAGGIAGAVCHVGDAGDAGDDRAVVARPLECRDPAGGLCRRHCARFRSSRLVNLHAVELVLHSGVCRARGQAARARRSRRSCAGA